MNRMSDTPILLYEESSVVVVSCCPTAASSTAVADSIAQDESNCNSSCFCRNDICYSMNYSTLRGAANLIVCLWLPCSLSYSLIWIWPHYYYYYDVLVWIIRIPFKNFKKSGIRRDHE